MYNLLCSLNFLHTANIMHRDIKSANILMNKVGAVKLADFNVLKKVGGKDIGAMGGGGGPNSKRSQQRNAEAKNVSTTRCLELSTSKATLPFMRARRIASKTPTERLVSHGMA